MTSIILSALLPILFVAFLGWLAGRMALFGPQATTTLSTFVVRFALPLSLFLAAARTKPEQLTDARYALSLAIGLIGSYVLGLLLGRLVFKHDLRASALQGLSCSFPNMAYCGPPVLIAAVGAQGVLAVIVGNLIVTVILVPATMVLLQLAAPATGDKTESEWRTIARSLMGAVKQPLVWLPVLGAAFALTGLHLPALVDNSVDQIGQSAGGVALFTLGLMLSERRLRLDRDILANLALKNLLQPAILLGAALALKLEPTLAKEVFLTGVLPSATAASVLAQRYDAYVEQAAGTTAASTFFSIITIAGGLAIAATF
ncbi:MAG TPA: AEC family transporter [Aliidongia sp.]|nr:AEC family transporter [Aliidongia sp.]